MKSWKVHTKENSTMQISLEKAKLVDILQELIDSKIDIHSM